MRQLRIGSRRRRAAGISAKGHSREKDSGITATQHLQLQALFYPVRDPHDVIAVGVVAARAERGGRSVDRRGEDVRR